MSKKYALIFFIIACGLFLRIYGINFGLPNLYHIDEPAYVSAALKLGKGILSDPPYDPTGFVNILFAEYGLFYVVGRILRFFNSAGEFEILYRTDPSYFYLISRLSSVLLGTATIAVVYKLGKTLRSEFTGLFASFFLAVCFMHVRESHFGTPDIAMTFFVVLCVFLCVVATEKVSLKYLGLAGLAGGFAIATKWIALPVVFPLFISGIMFVNTLHRKSTWNWMKVLITLLTGIVTGIIIGSIQIILNPTPYLGKIEAEFLTAKNLGFLGFQVDTLPGWLFYLKMMFYGLGGVLLGLALAGFLIRLVQTIRQRNATGVLVLSFFITYFLIMGATFHYFARYALPLIPFMVIFAAEAIGFLQRLKGYPNQYVRISLPLIILGLAIIQPLANSIRLDEILTRMDTRTLAKQWIESSIPEGSKIAMDWEVHGPPLSTPQTATPFSKCTYDVTLIGGAGLSDHPINWYYQQGFDVLITSSNITNISLISKEKDSLRQAFYSSLDQKLNLIRIFKPVQEEIEPAFIFDEIYSPMISLWQRDRPGPTIKIYQLK